MFGWLSGDKVDRTGGDGVNPTPGASASGTSQHLALYKYDACPFCQRVHRAIDALDVNIEYRDVRSSSAWRQDLMKRTGRSQVPCLFIDGEPLFESADIIAFLGKNYPARR